MHICGTAGVSSVTRMPLGVVVSQPETREMFFGVMMEVVALAQAKGITKLTRENAIESLNRSVKHFTESPG